MTPNGVTNVVIMSDPNDLNHKFGIILNSTTDMSKINYTYTIQKPGSGVSFATNSYVPGDIDCSDSVFALDPNINTDYDRSYAEFDNRDPSFCDMTTISSH